jgi:hypothetical protein
MLVFAHARTLSRLTRFLRRTGLHFAGKRYACPPARQHVTFVIYTIKLRATSSLVEETRSKKREQQ